jgi:DNA-directed RNA polymerase subunit F
MLLKMKERIMKITGEQFEHLEHYKRMFELNADRIRELCNEERSDN